MIRATLRKLGLFPLIAIMLIAAGACASTGSTEGNQVTVHIENNAAAQSQMTLYAVPETGVRTVLGSIDPNETKTMTFTATSMRYQLVADPLTGADIVSRPFTATPGDVLRWNLSTNMVVPVTDGS